MEHLDDWSYYKFIIIQDGEAIGFTQEYASCFPNSTVGGMENAMEVANMDNLEYIPVRKHGRNNNFPE